MQHDQAADGRKGSHTATGSEPAETPTGRPKEFTSSPPPTHDPPFATRTGGRQSAESGEGKGKRKHHRGLVMHHPAHNANGVWSTMVDHGRPWTTMSPHGRSWATHVLFFGVSATTVDHVCDMWGRTRQHRFP